MQRRFYLAQHLEAPYTEGEELERIRYESAEAEANLISSETDSGEHMPVLDIDRIPVRVVESSTPGNCHLYIDKPMSWQLYAELLTLLGEAGILEPGYVSASLERRATFVRKPGVRKGEEVPA